MNDNWPIYVQIDGVRSPGLLSRLTAVIGRVTKAGQPRSGGQAPRRMPVRQAVLRGAAWQWRHRIIADHVRVEPGACLGNPALGAEIHEDDAEPLLVAPGPFEIV